MTDSIQIRGIEVFAHHGVFEKERADGQMFVVDLDLTIDLGPAGRSDDLNDTVDYGKLTAKVHDLVASTRHDLIEKIAADVADAVLAENGVESVSVTIHKPEAPIDVPFADVSVTVRRGR